MRNRTSVECNGRMGEFFAVAGLPGTSGTDLSTIEKASRDLISRPYIYNGDLFVVKNGSVIQYD